MYVLHILLVSYYTNKGLVLLKLASKIVRPSPYVHNTRPCYVKSVSVCIIVYIYFYIPMTSQQQYKLRLTLLGNLIAV